MSIGGLGLDEHCFVNLEDGIDVVVWAAIGCGLRNCAVIGYRQQVGYHQVIGHRDRHRGGHRDVHHCHRLQSW